MFQFSILVLARRSSNHLYLFTYLWEVLFIIKQYFFMQFTLHLWSVISGMEVTSLVWALQALVSVAIWSGISRYILQWSNLSHYLHVIIDTVRKALPQMEQFSRKSKLCLSKPENWLMKTSLISLCSHHWPHEVNFYQEDLDSFLAIAEEFHLEGGKLRTKSKLKPTPAKLQHPEIQKRET